MKVNRASSFALLSLSLLALPCAAKAPATTRQRNDLSSPRATFDSLIGDLRADDLPALRDCFTASTPVARQFMDAYTEVTVTTHRLAQAMKKHMANDPDAPPDIAARLEAPYADARVETEGDQAWLLRNGESRENALTFTKVNGQWKIDTEKTYKLDTDRGRKGAEQVIESAPKLSRTLKPLIDEINTGKIKSIAELRQRLTGAGPTTAPSTRP